MKKKKVIAYIHTHWDREWYREFEEFRLRLIEIFDDVLNDIENSDLPFFYFDGQVSALCDYLEIRKEKTNLIKKFVKEKKLRIGPFYCSSDSLLVNGESLYRNLEIGMNIAKEFNENEFIAYIADSFGHSKDIPVLLKALGISTACFWRGLGEVNADFNFNGIKSVNLIQGYFQDFLHSDLSIEEKAKKLKPYIDKIAQKSSDIILLPIGADHLASVKNIIKIINELNNIYNDYEIVIGTPFDYFAQIKTNRQKIIGELLDNTKTFLLKGVYSARLKIKIANAQNQWLLTRIAEPFNLLASNFLGAKNKQNEIKYAYKELIKNHAHDSIYGCVIDKTANDIMNRYVTVNTIANGIIKRTIRDIEDENAALSVVNLSNYNYSGKVFIETEKFLPEYLNALKISSRLGFTDKKLYNINDIPITEDITNINTYIIDVKDLEPFSLTKITKEKINNVYNLKSDNNYIENNFIKLEIKDNKINVEDKKTGKIYKDFIKIVDKADIGDSYNFGALTNDIPIHADIKSVKLKETNNIRAVLNVICEIYIPINSNSKGRLKKKHKCKINIDFILYNQSPMIEVYINWINKSRNHILQIGFNLKDKITSTISEDLFSTVKREFNPDYDIYKQIPAKKGIELKTNTAPMQRFVNVKDLTIITKGLNEYEINKNTIFITLLRAVGIISNPKNTTRGTSAGPPLLTPDMQCIGHNSAYFAFAFTGIEEEMYKLTENFYYPCISLFTNKKDIIFLKPNGRLYAIEQKNDKLIQHIYSNGKLNISGVCSHKLSF